MYVTSFHADLKTIYSQNRHNEYIHYLKHLLKNVIYLNKHALEPPLPYTLLSSLIFEEQVLSKGYRYISKYGILFTCMFGKSLLQGTFITEY